MLLHWFKSLFVDELRVFIHPHHIVLLRLKRSFKSKLKQEVVYQQRIDFANNVQDVECIQVILKNALAHSQWQGAMPIIVLSNHFVRYSVIPWNIELTGEVERQAYLKHCFNQSFGDVAKSWDFCMSEPVFGKPAIASAISANLLTVLHDVFDQVGLKIVAISPHLMLAINSTLSQIKTVSQIKQSVSSQHKSEEYTFWLVSIENGRVCLALMESGGWRLVKNVAMEDNVTEQVTSLIQRVTIICNVEYEAPVLLYWPESHSTQPLKLAKHKVMKVSPHPFDIQSQQVSNNLQNWALI